ncbi:helix-turn-helix domain-containing protein [Aquibacillus halophilus]|uniref:Helix-turn-helix domain-containing protein n=1 Tax=Aquibacillus halophilus TaxID=930132 RepID=A0A6A8DTL5_9BACI|nr:helix-turn-helix transcriptional regulator [Aquibacillus halophilus]MRH44572.1 helix-turn-helix domain-containing protein [Aquibacillus halophilus]
MDVGPFIKLQRIKQNMKQEDLAKGIVSESYLSKIENQKTNASSKVIQMLFRRLGVGNSDNEDVYIKEKCNEWFKMLFGTTDKEELRRRYDELEGLISLCYTDIQTQFEIFKVRYYLLIDDQSKSLEQLLMLKELRDSFNEVELFFWYKFVGNYHSYTEEFNLAMRFYKLAEEKLELLDLDESESADLNYTIAVTYSKLRDTLKVIDYITKALKFYRKNYHLTRCGQGHILLGISYRRIRMFDKAIENYNLADEISKINNNQELKRLVNINLGYLYASKRESKKAVSYFELVLEDKEATNKDLLIAITSLAEEYYYTNELDKKRTVIDQGLKLLTKLEASGDKYRYFHMKLHAHFYLLTEKFDKFESLVIEELIPYLQKQNDIGSIVTYGTLMGWYFEQAKKYKFATHYYKLSNNAYGQLIQI